MDQCDVVEKPLLERIQSELEADPELYDVTFSVGPQKTKVKALKVILLAASPVFKNEFKTKWSNAVVKDGNGIPLPQFDGESFQLFIKLTSLDTWSEEVLGKLNLSISQLHDLLSVCRYYKMLTAVKNLEELMTTFIRSFAKFKDTTDFLRLSQANLKELLASDDLPLEEMQVFKYALRWAEWQCREKKIDASVDNFRHVLGDCLNEIRFPTMSNVDFTNAMEIKELLSRDESLQIYKYVGLDASKRQRIDVLSLAFKAKRRNFQSLFSNVWLSKPNSGALQPQLRQTPVGHAAAQTFKMKPSASVKPMGTPTAKPFGCFTLSLLNESRKIDSETFFVCDGSLHRHQFISKQRVAVVGLGFAGPIDADAFYDVTVDMNACWVGLTGGKIIKKNIFALKDQPFYFVFDEPVTLELNQWRCISYSLKGPKTSSVVGGDYKHTKLQEGSSRFGLNFLSNQLSEILFKSL